MSYFYTLAAAIMFFTKLPLWKVINVPSEYFRRIIYYWPLMGWITGGIMAAVYLAASLVFPPLIAIILAIGARTLLTGALHEDGLGDFFDGFGGGRTKADVLRIMKDSHTGSFALIGLIFYYLLFVHSLQALPASIMISVMVAADPLSKMLTALMMNTLPYARNEAESKAKTLFDKTGKYTVLLLIFGLLPFFLEIHFQYWWVLLFPVVTVLFMRQLAKKKIEGYTGDVCGATALLCELSFYLGMAALM